MAAMLAAAGSAVGRAQTMPGRFQGQSLGEARERVKIQNLGAELTKMGHVIAPGIVLVPTVSLETGYDSNPDQSFKHAHATPYGLVGGSVMLGFVHADGATTLAGKGNLLRYDEETLDGTRWDGGAAIDNAYKLAPGVETAFGAYVLRNEINLEPSQYAGGYSKLSYSRDPIELSLLSRLEDIRNFGPVRFAEAVPPALLPFVQASQFNVRRMELLANVLVGRDRPIGVYGEIGGADIDYTDQGVEADLDRDGSEVWALAGVRVTFDKTLIADIGYRFNQRHLEDAWVPSHASSYFDGKLVWSPLDSVKVVLDVDQVLVEPSSAMALVGEQTTYALRATSSPGPAWRLDLHAHYRRLEEIGDSPIFIERAVGGSARYLLSDAQSVYGLIEFKNVTDISSDAHFDWLRIGMGYNFSF